MATAAALQPAGTVTKAMPTPAAREGAFRLLESRRFESEALTEAVGESTALGCGDEHRLWIPIDQADLTFVDRKGCRGLGPVNNRNSDWLTGIQVMNSLALDFAGVPVGMLHQQWWLRPPERTPDSPYDTRRPEDRESWNWVRSLRACKRRLDAHAPTAKPWFVIDRGADCWAVFEEAKDLGVLITVRAAQNRILMRDGKERHLFSTLRAQPVLGTTELKIPGGHGRAARIARFELRALKSDFRFTIRTPRRVMKLELHAVRLRELSPVPAGEQRIEWVLLTNYSVKSLEDANLVVHGYSMRWRIEEFHRTWKSGACNIEASQLRSFDAIRRWATILAAVAARVERLKRLSRETPDVDALQEFSEEELEATIVLSQTKKFKVGAAISLWDAVCLVAQIGGYMNRKSDGPPGSSLINRGLGFVTPAAAVLRATRERSD